MRLRTIKQCYEHIKQQDKDSAVTIYLIRTLCSQEKVYYIKAGKKILINLDSLISYFAATNPTNEERSKSYGNN